nr:MAG TPA: hypothetical protein [Bacteriophage sp.]
MLEVAIAFATDGIADRFRKSLLSNCKQCIYNVYVQFFYKWVTYEK